MKGRHTPQAIGRWQGRTPVGLMAPVLFVMCLSLVLAPSGGAAEGSVTVTDIVTRYRALAEKTPPFVMIVDTQSSRKVNGPYWKGLKNTRKEHDLVEYRWNKGDLDLLSPPSWSGDPPPGARRFRDLYLGGRWLAFTSDSFYHNLGVDETKSSAKVQADRSIAVVVPLNLVLGPTEERPFDDILERNASDLRVNPGMETINGGRCLVVEGNTRYGYYKIWIDTDHGYQPCKAIARKRAGDLVDERRPFEYQGSDTATVLPVSTREATQFELSGVQFQEAGGHFFLLRAERDHSMSQDESSVAISFTDRVSQLQVNPDFQKIGAFSTEFIPNGTTLVTKMDAPGMGTAKGAPFVPYGWQSGQIVPMTKAELREMHSNAAQKARAAGYDEAHRRQESTGSVPVILWWVVGLAPVLWVMIAFVRKRA
jgi:hypothetical protein